MRIRPGVHRIQVPTTLPVGTVNCYALRGEPLTLVDVGPKTPDALDALRRGLREIGHAIADVEQVLVTHGHVDHHGLCETVRKESGAKILMPEADAALLQDFEGTWAARRERFRAEFGRVGTPPETYDLVGGFFDYLTTLGESTEVSRTIREGDTLVAGDRQLRAIHTPGHSSGSTCLLSPEGWLFAGDTLLKDLTPNAAFGGADGTSVGLGDYIASLNRLRTLDVDLVLPGHRGVLDDHRAYIDESLGRYRARQAAVLETLRRGSRTGWGIVLELFGTLPLEQVFLGITEVLGHLEILSHEGVVSAKEEDGVLRFALA